MGRRHVLLLHPAGLTAYRCEGAQAVAAAEFRAGDAAGFDAYAAPRAHEEFALLVDVPDESFEAERLPHVRGRAYTALLQRKRERHCHGSPLCAALPQGRQPDGRRDDRVLFAALTRPQMVEPWLQRLRLAQAPVRGVYSLPLIAAGMAPDRHAGTYLLATLGRAGLRQTFIVDGHLRFSRLTPLAGDGIGEVAIACAAEAANMRRYLCGQRLIGHDARLPVVALVHPDEMDEFRRHCRDSEDLEFDCLDLVAEAARRGCTISQRGSSSDALFAGLLGRRPPRCQFAAGPVRFHWQSQRLRRAVDVFGWGGFAAALLFAAGQLHGVLHARDATAALRSENDAYEQAHGAPPNGRPLSSSRSQLRELAAASAALARVSVDPAPLLRRLGNAMEALPAIELEALDWQVVGELEQARGPHAVLEVRGFCATDDPSEQQRNIDRLADGLRAEPALRTIVLKRPAALASTQTIRSGDAAKTDAGFVLRLVQTL